MFTLKKRETNRQKNLPSLVVPYEAVANNDAKTAKERRSIAESIVATQIPPFRKVKGNPKVSPLRIEPRTSIVPQRSVAPSVLRSTG